MTVRDYDAELDQARRDYAAAHAEEIAAARTAAQADAEFDDFCDWWIAQREYLDEVWRPRPLVLRRVVDEEGGLLGFGATKVYGPSTERTRAEHWGRVIDFAVPGYDYGDEPGRALVNDSLSVWPYDDRGVPEAMVDEHRFGYRLDREDRDTVVRLLIEGVAARTTT